jgi:hypothetical protein
MQSSWILYLISRENNSWCNGKLVVFTVSCLNDNKKKKSACLVQTHCFPKYFQSKIGEVYRRGTCGYGGWLECCVFKATPQSSWPNTIKGCFSFMSQAQVTCQGCLLHGHPSSFHLTIRPFGASKACTLPCFFQLRKGWGRTWRVEGEIPKNRSEVPAISSAHKLSRVSWLAACLGGWEMEFSCGSSVLCHHGI